ncbi:hypothetical protein J6590_032860 [Homalodisca vitripennis]|nr:hypothetical protein J6590_032860 [Homalodisca vitripennis]
MGNVLTEVQTQSAGHNISHKHGPRLDPSNESVSAILHCAFLGFSGVSQFVTLSERACPVFPTRSIAIFRCILPSKARIKYTTDFIYSVYYGCHELPQPGVARGSV